MHRIHSTISIFLSFFLLLLISCNSESNSGSGEYASGTMFQKMKEKTTGVSFKNTITEDVDFHHLNWESIYNGGGVTVGDFDNDGLMDIFFTGNQVDDAIYKNLGDWNFEDKSEASGINALKGWSSGVTVADVNNDNLLDIYVCRMWHAKDGVEDDIRKNLLWINQGDFTFKESAEEYGLADKGHGTQASFFDYDSDGDLDMYLLNAPSNNYSQKLVYIQNNEIPYVHADKLFRNDGGSFVDVSKEAGIEDYGFGLGLVTVDINGDNLTDIYVANDFEIADKMYINQGDGTFVDQVQKYLKHISFSSMGADIADFNNDNRPDIAVLDMQSSDHFRSKTNMPSMDTERFWTNVSRGQHFQYMTNMLQINNGSGFFSEVGHLAGMSSTDWSWSVLMADFDQDGNKDMFITNGLNKDIRNNDFSERMKKERITDPQELFEFSQQVSSQPIENLIYKSDPTTMKLTVMNEKWGGIDQGYSFGASYVDLDNDGDLDLIVNNNNDKASLFQNKNNGNYITISPTKGGKVVPNTKVEIYQDGMSQYYETTRTRGFQSTTSPNAHFGLANNNNLDSIIVSFPTGEQYFQKNVSANQVLKVEYTDATLRSKPSPEEKTFAFEDVTGESGIDFRHRENRFNDFEKEILLPHRQSTQGPGIAVGDINNDGYDDLFMGNAHGSSGKLYVGSSTGYQISVQIAFEADKDYEDQSAVFFDADGDEDLDLYVVSGGSQAPANNPIYQDRLYINSNGTFEKSDLLPQAYLNGSCVKPIDFNQDGKMDLFVGGRSVPQSYPSFEKNQLLINTENGFVDQIESIAPELQKVGMVYDASWTDINGDDKMDLIVVGEFMTPQVFIHASNQLENKSEEYIPEHMSGWWYSVEAKDLNNDGTPEFILGNIGMNNKYHPNPEHPLRIYGSDFDKNNTPDIVLSKTTDKYGEVPVRGRECSSQQMPFIKNKFKDFNSFASASLEDIYGEKDLEKAITLEANNFYSGYLSLENGSFTFHKFPAWAQISAVRDIEFADYDNDGDEDIILIGNMYDAEVETVRHDSSLGLILENDYPNFHSKRFTDTGWYTPGNAREIAKTTFKGKPAFIVTNNGFVSQVITMNNG